MRSKKYVWMAALALATTVGLSSCNKDDINEKEPSNPAAKVVLENKKHDTAILLCTFGSTFKEPIKTYENILADYRSAFPDADIYLSFTSRTCVNRVHAETGFERYQPDLWLDALGNAGYKKVAVQSLHIIPGEEYLSLMNTDVKKNFMIKGFPKIQVAKSPCLLYDDADIETVADAVYAHYQTPLSKKTNLLLLMGHGNPDENYNANIKYTETENALQKRAVHRNVLIGTVDYGPMLFYPEEGEANPECVYAKLNKYCADNQLKPSEVTVYLAPFMSIAGDHAHNDLWGIEEGEDASKATATSEACWRLKLKKMGFNISMEESHNGNVNQCKIIGLGDYKAIRDLWVNHLKTIYNDADNWQTGEEYQ